MKVFIIGGNHQYYNLFKTMGFNVIADVEGADLVCFTGGEDVSPSFYGDKAHPQTFSNYKRDEYEAKIFHYACANGIPMVGICRGGQFLNVMNGGRMYQHVEEHAVRDGHFITDAIDGDHIFVSSTHHQMMMPAPSALVVATAALGGDREWFEKDVFCRDNSDKDYEVVYYKDTNTLCFQPHPEFPGTTYLAMREYFSKCLNKYLGVKT